MEMECDKYVKENILVRPPLSMWWVVAGLAASAAALAAVALVDLALPDPLTRAAPPDRFIADIAYEHLLNLTSIGPRVAGSYENEVLAVGVIVEAVKRIARDASPHNRVELDVHTASGAFPLTFLDGMNNVYRDVSSVVARVSGVGGRAPHRSALLLNCHIDTVPDSPGASDDGAGCAVLLETLRALAASRRPLRHDAVFLFNGAEENIMQASHGFITRHKWAKSVRAFINIEACGAGGREVMFQAGPHDPWLVEVYAAAVPHPFASSLAQEMFQSGLIPADTDFRIFRDFGRLSGVDLAWSANGHVYHTRLDTAARVPRAALQRTGDNVLALTLGMLSSARMESEVELASRQPVFFDVLGLWVVTARAPLAFGVAGAALALVALDLHVTARRAQRELYVSYGAWLRVVARAAAATLGAGAAGAAAAAAVALAMCAAGARLTFYSRGWLLAPLYALPALAGAWSALARLHRPAAPVRGWWAARALHGAGAALAAAALAACVAAGLRSGFLPLLWAAAPAAAELAAGRTRGGWRAAAWAAGAMVPVLQTWYLALGSLRTLVPMAGRAGAGAVPADVLVALLVALLVLTACGWLLPMVAAARRMHVLVYCLVATSAAVAVLASTTALGAPYSAETPQRLMVFHTRRTLHAPHAPPAVESFYWIPALDDNSPHSVDEYAAEIRAARGVGAAECARWLYCGAPYYLPVLSLVARSHTAPAPAPPLPVLRVNVTAHRVNDSAHDLTLDLQGPAHIVVIVSPCEGARVAWSSAVEAPLEGPRWGRRRVYFFALHGARGGAAWRLRLVLRHGARAAAAALAQVSAAGHALFGAHKLAPAHARLLAALPPWVAATGWGVDLHLFEV